MQILKVIIIYMLLCSSLLAVGSYNGGDGSAEYPFEINTPEQFSSIKFHREDWDKNFIMTADLDFSNISESEQWRYSCIFEGSPSDYFTGVFDGNFHTIKGVDHIFYSLFGFNGYYRPGGLIKNVILSVVSISSDMSGSIFVDSNFGTIENCSVTDTNLELDSTDPNFAWLSSMDLSCFVKRNYGVIKDCHVNVGITTDGKISLYGLVQYNMKTGIIENCSTEIIYTGCVDQFAGLAYVNTGLVSGCHTRSDITATKYMDGISGTILFNGGVYGFDYNNEKNAVAIIENCTAELAYRETSKLEFPRYGIAGITLTNTNKSIIRGCKVVLDVSNSDGFVNEAGGISCYNYGLISECVAKGKFNASGVDFGGITCLNYGEVIRCWTAMDECKGDRAGGVVCIQSGMGTLTRNCFATGNTVSHGYGGGLIGYAGGVTRACYSTGNASAYGSEGEAGGLAGGSSGTISYCYATGTALANDSAGGAVGLFYCGTISNCYASGDVYAANDGGGFVGSILEKGSISDCFSTGNIFSYDCAGGFVGGYRGCRISNCYSTGGYLGEQGIKAGFMGINRGIFSYPWTIRQRVKNSFWNTESSGLSDAESEGHSRGITALNNSGFASLKNFSKVGWDIDDSNAASTWTLSKGIIGPRLTGFMPQTIAIDSVYFKADSDRTGNISDSVVIKGRLNSAKFATSVDVRKAMQDISFSISHYDNENIYGYSQVIAAKDIKVNKNGDYLIYRNSQPGITSLYIDLDENTFEVRISNTDLSGIQAPLEIVLECGEFSVSTVAAETLEQYQASQADTPQIVDVINGKKDIPIKLIDGVTDSLRVVKSVVMPGSKARDSYLYFAGELAVSDRTLDITGSDITISFGDYAVTLPADDIVKISKKRVFKYKFSGGKDEPTILAVFDLDKCKYQIIIKDKITITQPAPAILTISFGNYAQAVEVGY